MKYQIPFPPKIPFAPSDDFIRQITQRLGNCDLELFPWISISLIHSSYLNENQNKLDSIESNAIAILESLGASFWDLALFNIAHEDDSLKGVIDYTRFVQNAKQARSVESLFDDFGLEKVSLIGKGEKKDLSYTVKFTIARQFAGALLLCYGYDLLKPIVHKQVKVVTDNPEFLDHKSMLQEYLQAQNMGRPQYDLIEAIGPDHQKEFVYQVSSIDGKSAQAKGNSKHSASRKAAWEYIKKFVPKLLTNKHGQPQSEIGATPTPVPLHKDFVLSMCKVFHVEPDKAWIFSQSLTHPSFVNETIHRQLIDYRRHAQLGAKVIETLISQQISYLALANLNNYSMSIEQYRSIIGTHNPSVEGFNLLNLQNGVLLGAGVKKAFHESPGGKAEIFQAIIGAAFMCHGTWKSFVNHLPPVLENWLFDRLQGIHNIKTVSEFDPISGLHVVLQAIRVGHQYKYIVSGPDHQKNYKAYLYLQSETTPKTFTIKSTKGFSSKRLATRHVALTALKAINIVNSELGVIAEASYEDNAELMRFAKFILHQELSIYLKTAEILRWQKLGILGSQLLMEGKMYEFRLWAIAIGNVLQSDESTVNALRLYSSIPIMSEGDQLGYKADAISVGHFVENLSPDVNNADVRLSDGFDKVVKLSKIYKLISQKWGTVTMLQIIDDLLLLRRTRTPEVRLGSKIPEIRISEKEGIYQTIFLEILGLLENLNPESKESIIDVRFDHKAQKFELNITFASDRPCIPSEKLLKYLSLDMLWKYLYREANITDVYADASTIRFSIKTFSSDNTFASQALDAYKMTTMLSRSENQATSQLLHDLKNQLIAYQVALDMARKDRTSILKAKFEASQHLDNALAICNSLETVSNSMTSPTIEPIDIGEFIRSYIVEKLTVLPLNIRLETPKSTGSSIVYTSKSFLRSIFENLVKNSVEAMPMGGEIRVDWLYDELVGLLMIDISDTGPGLGPEIMNKLKSGRVIDSSKHRGSGIGILSVQSMVERLGGSCSVSSNLGKGTQWNITLTSLSPQESLALSEVVESLETIANDELELQ